MSSTYRPNIDGLRALAVLSVIGFHIFPQLFPGGFVGVDVFFVISGYLISSLIFDGLSKKTFGFLDFYSRRIRRIFPALVIVMLTVFLCGWFILLDDEFQQLGKHIFAGASFISNLALWQESGYFDTSATSKPLLHLWSLGIEEQFYIFWPILLFVIRKKKLNAVFCLSLIFCASFIVDLYTVNNTQANFYSPLSRFWELSLGGLLACFQIKRLSIKKMTQVKKNIFAVVGLLLIVTATFLLKEHNYFPGWRALLPTVGAILILASGTQTWVNRKLFSARIMVGIGLISYPLYLWHWPVLSLTKVLMGRMPSYILGVCLMTIIFPISFLTYRLVEKPIRFGSYRRTSTLVLFLLMICVGGLGFWVYNNNGIQSRSVVQLNNEFMASTELRSGANYAAQGCLLSDPEKSSVEYCIQDRREPAQYAIWGDSKAEALYWGFLRESSPNKRWLLIARGSCAPMGDVERISMYGGDPKGCALANRTALNALATSPQIKVVVIVAATRMLMIPQYAKAGSNQASESAAQEGLNNAAKTLQAAGKKVIFVVDNPSLPDPKECIDRRLIGVDFLNQILKDKIKNPNCTISYDEYLERTKGYRDIVNYLVNANHDLVVYDPTPLFCDVPNKFCSVRKNEKFLYSYGDHVSDVANGAIAKDIILIADKILSK